MFHIVECILPHPASRLGFIINWMKSASYPRVFGCCPEPQWPPGCFVRIQTDGSPSDSGEAVSERCGDSADSDVCVRAHGHSLPSSSSGAVAHVPPAKMQESISLDPERHKRHLVAIFHLVQDDIHFRGSHQHHLVGTPMGQVTLYVTVFIDV